MLLMQEGMFRRVPLAEEGKDFLKRFAQSIYERSMERGYLNSAKEFMAKEVSLATKLACICYIVDLAYTCAKREVPFDTPGLEVPKDFVIAGCHLAEYYLGEQMIAVDIAHRSKEEEAEILIYEELKTMKKNKSFTVADISFSNCLTGHFGEHNIQEKDELHYIEARLRTLADQGVISASCTNDTRATFHNVVVGVGRGR